MKKTLHFLNWHQPLIDLFAERLITLGKGDWPKDFSNLQILVPTAGAGRRLRAAMALKCQTSGGAVNCHVSLPEQLLQHASDPELDCRRLLAGCDLLLKKKFWRKLPALFPKEYADRYNSLEWHLSVLQSLETCRKELARGGWSLEEALSCLQNTPDFSYNTALERFLDLLKLDREICQNLPPGWTEISRQSNLVKPLNPETKIILAGIPHLSGSIIKALESLPNEVEVWIGAPEELSNAFDHWGRPLPEFWKQWHMELDLEKQVRCFPNPAAQADKIIELLKDPVTAFNPEVIGIMDPEIAEILLARQVSAHHIPSFQYSGTTPLSCGLWSSTLLNILQLPDNEDIDPIRTLLHNPQIGKFLVAKEKIRSCAELMKSYDRMQMEHLFQDYPGFCNFAAKGKFPAVQAFAHQLHQWIQLLKTSDNPLLTAFGILGEIAMAAPPVDPEATADELSLLKPLLSTVVNCTNGDLQQGRLLLQMLLNNTPMIHSVTPEENFIDLEDLIELNFYSEKELILAGVNEENFNYGNPADSLLPEALRKLLQLPTTENRYAVSVWQLQSLLRSRNVSIFYGKSSMHADCYRPATVLMQCNEKELPQRCLKLFSNDLAERTATSKNTGHFPPLYPRVATFPRTMSATGFADYLSSPLHYYLQHILKMNQADDQRIELDNAQYGTAVHAVLQKYGEVSCAEGIPENKALDFCRHTLTAFWEENFGTPKGITLQQYDLLMAQLEYFVQAQIETEKRGWQIWRTEQEILMDWHELCRKFHSGYGFSSKIPVDRPITLKCRIDRIDYKPSSGEIRILDYKTGQKTDPVSAHLGSKGKPFAAVKIPTTKVMTVRAGGISFGALTEVCDTTKYWKDLQLPLYLLAVLHFMDDLPVEDDARLSGGYFCLPPILTETGIKSWNDLSHQKLLHGAMCCADAILDLIFEQKEFQTADNNSFAARELSKHYLLGKRDTFSGINFDQPGETL